MFQVKLRPATLQIVLQLLIWQSSFATVQKPALLLNSSMTSSPEKNDAPCLRVPNPFRGSSQATAHSTFARDPTTLSWLSKSNGDIDKFSVIGGIDVGRKIMHVARFMNDGNLIPGKISSAYKFGHYPFGMTEMADDNYEVLVSPAGAVSWVAVDGIIPPNSIRGGYDSNGNLLFIGRGRIGETLTVGMVQPPGQARISFGGHVYAFSKYEILVLNAYGQALSSGYKYGKVTGQRETQNSGNLTACSSATIE